MTNSLDISSLTFAIPARVLRPTAQRQADLLAVAKEKHAIDPEILSERAPFFWGAEISSDVVDSYYTHMLMNTLTNFRDDARAGVSFLPGHKHYELPFGRSLDAVLEDAADPPRTRVAADFYTIPGLNLNGVKTDDLIDGIRSGIVRDVSVGFYGGKMICDICGRDFWDWDCSHIPGRKYEVDDNGVIRVKVATFGVDDARLAEVSAVFEGATPNATILKAEREAEMGRIDPEAVRYIETRYRIQLPERNRAFAGLEISDRAQPTTPGEEVDMDAEQLKQVADVLVRAKAMTEGQASDPAPLAVIAGVKSLAERVTELEPLEGRVKELEPQAAEGRQYRSDIIAAALTEGVRAFGQGFDKTGWQEDLQRLSLERVKSWRDMWQGIADTTLPAGRQTVDDDQTPTNHSQPAPRSMVPDGAFAG